MHPWVGLSDHVRLGAVTRWVTPELVAEALDDCGVRDRKPGALPARFMVYFTLALALFQQDSYDDVAEHMVGGVPELGESIPNKSSLSPGSPAPGSTGHRGSLPQADRAAGPCWPGGIVLPWDAARRRGRIRPGRSGDGSEPAAARRAEGGARAGGWVPPGEGGDADRDRDPRADRDAAVDGACCGEPELAIRLRPPQPQECYVIMDRGSPGSPCGARIPGPGPSLLIRARSVRPPGRSVPAGRDLPGPDEPGAGEKRAATGHVVLRVIEYRVDGGEVIRLLTDLLDPGALPGGRGSRPSTAAKVGGGVLVPPDQDVPARSAADPALRRPPPGVPGGMGAPGRPPLPDQNHHGAGRRRGNRPGPHLIPQGP